MSSSRPLPPKGEMPLNICMTCLKIDYQRWGKELFPKVYEGRGFNIQSVPDNLLKTVLTKVAFQSIEERKTVQMNPAAFSRMRRVTKFYSRFIETHRHLIKICLFHNRTIRFCPETRGDEKFDNISLKVDPMLPPPRGIAWEEIDEMSDEEAEKRNQKLEEETSKTGLVSTDNQDRADCRSVLPFTEYLMLMDEPSYYQLDPISVPDRFRELTGHCKPSFVSVDCINQPTDEQIETIASCLQSMNIVDKHISFSMISDYGLKKISEVVNPRRLKIDLHAKIVQYSVLQNRLGPSTPICSFHNFQNLTHLYLSNSYNILPNLPDNILRQLEVLFLNENGAEWTQVALRILQMFRDGTGQVKDITIEDITPHEGNSFSSLSSRIVSQFDLKPYARRSRMIKNFLEKYVTDFFLVQNQLTREIGVMHISYEMRFIKHQ